MSAMRLTAELFIHNDGTAATIGKVNNRLLPTQITDTNGNYIQIAYKWETNFPGMAINYIVDTLGRVIQFNYGQWPAPTSTSLSSISTPAGTITFGYQSVTMNYSFLTRGCGRECAREFLRGQQRDDSCAANLQLQLFGLRNGL